MPLGKTPAFRMLFIGLIVTAAWFAATEKCYSAGDFVVSIDVSRTAGVAPLSVSFDATGTPDLAAGSDVDATFAWNFDVTGIWGLPQMKQRQLPPGRRPARIFTWIDGNNSFGVLSPASDSLSSTSI